MESAPTENQKLQEEIKILRQQLSEMSERLILAEEMLQAIHYGEIDALVIMTEEGEKIFTLQGADHIYQLVVEQMGEGAATVSSEGLILYSNEKLSSLLNCSLENLIGSQLETFISPKDKKAFEQFFQQIQKEKVITTELSLITSTKETEIPVKLSVTKIKIGEDLINTIIITDLTIYKGKEEALRQGEERFRKSFMESIFPMIIHSENGEILQINKTWVEITGYTIKEMPTLTHWTKLAYKEEKQIVPSHIHQVYQLNDKVYEGELIIKTRSGENRIWEFSSVPLGKLNNGRRIAISMAKDVTERKQVENTLRYNVLHDPLTGLANRILLMELIERSFQRLKREPQYLFAVLFLDLDNFKYINDTFGHHIGDLVLNKIAQNLTHSVRSNDTVARLGGDEFVVLLENIQTSQEAVQIVQRILDNLNLPLSIKEQELFLTASIGIAFSSNKVTQPTEILKNADLAMYEAKKIGKACYRIF